jgi:hypothetical protein
MSAPTIIHGPCQVEWAGLKFVTNDPVEVTLNPETFDIKTDTFGKIEPRLKSRTASIKFTPSGQWVGEALGLISAASGRVPGTSILAGPMVIKPLISPQLVHTVGRAGLTSVPDLFLSASKTMFGSLTFTGLAAADSTTGAIITQSAYSAPTSSFAPGNIITEPWIGNYGVKDGEGEFNPDADQVLLNIESEDGWTIRTEMGTQNLMADSWGVVDILQTDCGVSASCKPVGVTEAALLAFLERSAGADVALRPGMSFALDPNSCLYLKSLSGLFAATISNCGVTSGSMVWGSTRNRTDGLTFTAIRKFTTGAMQPMLAFENFGG